ncbi:unnamed protein product [Sphagnum jensenii]|jgi:hypothetical protein|uniref:Uncharacterized protein n=1 Tax=Sphagnum jensenii TaxID=128206 RepID=A0ABP0VLK2_9BRYO
MDGVSLEGQSPMDLEVGGAHMEVLEGRNANVEFTKEFYKIMTTKEELRILQTRSFFRMVATRSFKPVQAQLKLFGSSILTWMGYMVGVADLHKEWELSQDLKNSVSEIMNFLPDAKLAMTKPDGDVEVFFDSNDPVQEALHVATRLSYHIFIIWNLVIFASHRADDAEGEKKLIFHELLLHRRQHNELVSKAKNSAAAGFNNPKFDKIMNSISRIDEKFLQLVKKDLAERDQDEMLYHLGQMTEGRGFDNSLFAEKPEFDTSGDRSSKYCTATSFDGAWEIETKVPVLIMKVEGSSYKDRTEKLWWRSDRSLFILPLLSMVARLNIQIQVSMSLTPNLIMFTLGITQVNASFQGEMHNSVEGKKRMGPFFSRISFSVVPVNDTMWTGSVTMTSASPNAPMRFGVSEQRQMSLGAKIAAAPAGVLSLAAVKETKLEVEEKSWLPEQLSVHSGRGGSYTVTLSNLLGNRFDRLKPTAKAKKSILLWSDNIPANPVQQLPFASDWSVNFSPPDTFTWRFPKVFENTSQEFRIEGRMYITYITNINQHMVWETRMMPFECKLEQKLAPCG